MAIELRDPALEPVLRWWSSNQGVMAPAALAAIEALVSLGAPRGEFTHPLLVHLIGRHDGYDEIVRVCRDLVDPAALPRLRHLADCDSRSIGGGEHTANIWRDERNRRAVRAGIRALEDRSGSAP